MMKKTQEFFLIFIIGLVVPLSLLIISSTDTGPSQNAQTTVQTTVLEEKTASVNVRMDDGTVLAMALDDYIFCVVLREMPADFEMEALKAQAVVARTYTIRHMKKPKHDGAEVCTNSSCCQGYRSPEEYLQAGGTEEDLDKIRNAVESTANEILIYDGEPIDATYFSCSGGMTEDAAAVWGADVPYLKATASPGEEGANHYVDTVRTDVWELTKKLDIALSKSSQFTIGKIRYTSGGGVASVEICGETFTGTQLRKKLDLRSTAFVISVVGENITITTKGFGHRVGMSQYGADAMAVEGADYVKILTHYYTGVELSTIDAVY